WTGTFRHRRSSPASPVHWYPQCLGRSRLPRLCSAQQANREVLIGAEDEPVAFRIFHDDISAPRLLLRRPFKLNPALIQLTIGRLNVITGERAIHLRADATFLTFHSEQYDARLGLAHAELDPAPARSHFLIGSDLEPKFFGVEFEGSILIFNRNAHEFE